MTVVVYEGRNAEEEFKKDVARYMKFRCESHPSFFQLYGTVHSEYFNAIIFYEAMIPLKTFQSSYRRSPMLPCYVYAYAAHEFSAAASYLFSMFGLLLGPLGDYTLSLRPSTGRLCIDLKGNQGYVSLPVPGTENISPKCLLLTLDTQVITNALTVKQYHEICDTAFINRKYIPFPPTTTVYWGAVYHTTGHHNLSRPLVIAPMLHPDSIHEIGWLILGTMIWADYTTENGWSRFCLSKLVHPLDHKRFQRLTCNLWAKANTARDTWLSQANHIFNCLGVFSNLEDYALLYDICFTIGLQPRSPKPNEHLSNGFLFLCPPQSFQIGPASLKCPECVGYWSLDPFGLDPLSPNQAAELGFPTIDILIFGWGKKWSDAVYAGLRQFHHGKGFDPNSQDLARHLGLPLYRLYSENENFVNVDGTEAHIEELSSSDTEQSVDGDKPKT
ncbi:hypothetical protein R3P38DRAFT_890012 [Favolaschia claudopus]|uniref:Uncharacterized protein n=1 Tax=Favolaschia claudopus TaxID=2862362 RepID=A0AAW0BXE1_9AGAR